MSRSERYLPFILALLIPAIGIINNPYPQESRELIGRYLQSSVFLLGLWYLNKWLLDSSHQWIVPRRAIVLVSGNLLFILLVALFYMTFAPDRSLMRFSGVVVIVRLSFVALIFNAILRIFKGHRERSKLRMENLKLEAENLKYQVQTLKQQINPHFLFNSFNTLLDLIEEDQAGALQFTRSFAKIYRTVLQSSKHDLIPVKDEVQFLQDYWSILKVRFRDSIDLSIHVPNHLIDRMIPPLSLQLLVENAVKHNQADTQNPLKIEITGSKDRLKVKNRIQEKLYKTESEGVGLNNLQQRFKILSIPLSYGREGDCFVVHLPLLTEHYGQSN